MTKPRFVVLSLVLGFGFTALAAPNDSPESVVRRYLANAYDGRFEDLPGTSQFERQVRNLLRTRCVRIEHISLTLLPQNQEQVEVHADVAIEKTDPRNPETEPTTATIPLRFELAREGENWRITGIRNRDDELAEQLLRSSPAERERLLGQQPERISKGLTRALYARSLALMNSGKLPEARKACVLTRQIAIEAGDRGGEALALGGASLIPPDEDEGAPERLSRESLAIAETTGEIDVLARAWYDRGRSFQRTSGTGPSRAYTMLECYQKARQLAEKAEDPIILMRVLYSLANIAANAQSDYLAARRLIDEGIVLAREIGQVSGEMSFEMVLSTVYFQQGDRERGLFHHARATELAERLQAYAYPTLLVRSGVLLVEQGRYDEAQAAFARVLTRDQNGMALKFGDAPKNVIGAGLRSMALIEADKGNLSEAQCLNRESANYHLGSADTYLFELAPYYSGKGDDATALAFSLASLAQPRLYSYQNVVALVAAGHAYRALGNTDLALDAALEAIEIREGIDARVAGDELQRAYASGVMSNCYELAAEISLDTGDPVQALVYLERGRARVLADILENGRPGSTAETDAALQEREAELEHEVARIGMDLDRARAARDERAVASLTEELNRVRAVRASFDDGVRARSDRRQAARHYVDRAGMLDLAARLPPRTAALEYIVGERDLQIIVISRDASGNPRVIARTKPIGRKAVEQSANALMGMLSGNGLRVETAGREVYQLLIQPIERDIADTNALLVIPDEILWRIPFAALVDRRGHFLAERAAVMYAPSLTTFAAITDSRRKQRTQPVSLLAVGNPTLDAAAVQAAALFYRAATLSPLPEAEHEVDAVRALYDPAHALVLKRDQATESRTKKALHDATIAHFATHAILDDANPMYSRLMLAHDVQAQEDGWLEAWEVARLDLHADLVVLSACETARGRVGGGEGVVGLSWAFFLAGARATVATQWSVASDSTARFMIAFHRALRAPPTNPALHKAQSLRQAQLQFIRDKQKRHPFYWAAFVLLGDPSE